MHTNANLPVLNVNVHNMLEILDDMNDKCALVDHVFLQLLYAEVIPVKTKMKNHIEKNIPGGVTYKLYLSETALFLFLSTTNVIININRYEPKLPILNGRVEVCY